MIGVFLLPAFTRLGHLFESMRCNACVCRLDLGLYSHPKEFLGNGVKTHVNSRGKIPSTRRNLVIRGSNPQGCIKQDSDPDTLSIAYSGPQNSSIMLKGFWKGFGMYGCILMLVFWRLPVYIMCIGIYSTVENQSLFHTNCWQAGQGQQPPMASRWMLHTRMVMWRQRSRLLMGQRWRNQACWRHLFDPLRPTSLLPWDSSWSTTSSCLSAPRSSSEFCFGRAHRGFPTRMVYLYYISSLRYTILVGNPQRFICSSQWYWGSTSTGNFSLSGTWFKNLIEPTVSHFQTLLYFIC